MAKHGAEAVAQANGNIFTAEPHIRIDVEQVHVSEHTTSAICEIVVQLRNEKQEVRKSMKVVDVITFDAVGKITTVKAYKGPTTESA